MTHKKERKVYALEEKAMEEKAVEETRKAEDTKAAKKAKKAKQDFKPLNTTGPFGLKPDGSSKIKIIIFSILFMGLSQILFLREKLKGFLYMAIEILFICFASNIFWCISDMVTYGVYDGQVYNANAHDFILIDGVMSIMVVILFIVMYVLSIKGALRSYKKICISGRIENRSVLRTIDDAFPILSLSPAVALVLFFVFIPLIFTGLVAFTDYTVVTKQTFTWVGLDNFITMFGGDATWTAALGRVVIWTLIWAALATVTCYGGGLIVAVLLTDRKIKLAPIYRTIFILPYAVPAIVSMRVWYSLLNGTTGIINRTLEVIGFNGFLRDINVLGGADSMLHANMIPWLSDITVAKCVCILINLWAGFPYFMLLSMGTMTAISSDVIEAAKIDGANKFQIFKKITLPLVLYQTMPLVIMSFTHNVNNFGAIYYLTGGAPNASDTTTTFAQGTDIIVSWVYKLTVDQGKYRYASVLAIMVFVVLAPIAIWNFSRTKSFKEGEV
ncbi:MAG: carbohydrate ABC transporter permease [Eubacterium sp.]